MGFKFYNVVKTCAKHPKRKALAKGLCRPCYNTTNLAKNPEKRRTKHRRWSQIRRAKRYGLSIQQADVLALQPNCGICGRKLAEGCHTKEARHFDHDKKTGCFRGILCQQCNRALGFFNDDVATLQSAINYLNKFNQNLS